MNEEAKSQPPASSPPETPKCKYCKQEIPPKASKCHNCGEYQNKLRLLMFLPYVIPSVIVLISIAQVLVSYNQMQEAKKEKIDASVALKKAEEAVRIAVSASEDVNKASVEAKRMVAEIKTILDGTEKKVAELDRSIEDGNRAVTELQSLTRFNTIVLSAQSDDRDAYDQLWAWAGDGSFPFQKMAEHTKNKMLEESDAFFKLFEFANNISWKEEIDPNKLTLPQLQVIYKNVNEPIRLGIIQFIWEKRTDISKKERLQFLVDVLKDDKSLKVTKLAGHYFGEGTGDGYVPLSIKPHLEWWEKNKETIK